MNMNFYGKLGVYPLSLGPQISPSISNPTPLYDLGTCWNNTQQFTEKYKKLLGTGSIDSDTEAHLQSLILCIHMYAGIMAHGNTSGHLTLTNSLVGQKQEVSGGGEALIPGYPQETTSLRAEHNGALAIVLAIQESQIVREGATSSLIPINIWLVNAEVIRRIDKSADANSLNSHLVLDYDMRIETIMVMKMIQIPIIWSKVDSHIEERVYKKGEAPKWDEFSIGLNTQVDEWAGDIKKKVD